MILASVLMQGRAFYAKILGKPVGKYVEEGVPAGSNGYEWTFDLSLDKAAKAQATKLGLGGKIKNKGDDRGDFLQFRRGEFKGDGTTKNDPIKVVDHKGQPWDVKKLIGNGSILNVRFAVYPGRKGNKAIILAVQVWEHVAYVAKADFPTKEDEAGTDQEFPVSSEDTSGVAAPTFQEDDDGETA